MNKKIATIQTQYTTEIIEKSLIQTYLQSKNIDITTSKIISNYLSQHTPDPSLNKKIQALDITNIKQLENALELIMPPTDRKLNGAFFTPNYITNYIINTIEPQTNHRTIDPSCGCGAFLIALTEYHTHTHNKSIKQTVKENIYGADILPYNITRTKILLSIFALEHREILEDTDFNLICTDSLKHKWENNFDNVIGNPPYVKFQDLSDENRNFLAKKYNSISGGTYNLYFAFFELGYKLLSPNGKLGYITPNNYFTSLAGESLRAFFEQHKCIDKIIDFNAKKVFHAQTYTALTFLSKQQTEQIQYDKIPDNQSPETFLQNISTSPVNISELTTKKWRLLKDTEKTNIKNIETIGTPLKELFDICVGIATLKDEIFFIDGATDDGQFYTKISKNGKQYKIEKQITRSVYKISEFKSQTDIPKNKKQIIFPYTIDKKATIIPEDTFKQKYPLCYQYFLDHKEQLQSRDKGKTTNLPFYAWGRTQGLTRFGKKILNPTFSQHPRFLLVEDKEALFTNGYGIFYKETKTNQTTPFDDPNPITDIQNIDVVQKILNSQIMHYYVSNTSVSIDGGYPCYQKNFIEKFSIPQLSKDEITKLRNLSSQQDITQFLQSKYHIQI